MGVIAKKPNKHKMLEALPNEKLVAVGELFRRGESASYICKIIQGPWGLLKEEDSENLRKGLLKYRKDVIKYQVVEAMVDDGVVDAISRLAKRVDVANELAILIYTQKARVDKMLEREMQMAGLLNPVVSKEIEMLSRMLVQMKELQLQTGALARAEQTIAVEQTDDNGGFRFRVTSGASPVLDAFMNDSEDYVVPED